jgi:hypothetical protein
VRRVRARVGNVDRLRAGVEERVRPAVGAVDVGIEAQRLGAQRIRFPRAVSSLPDLLAFRELLFEVVDRRSSAHELLVEQKLLVQAECWS